MRIGDIFVPENMYYTREHEWATIIGGGRVRIGITDYAQRELHEVVFVDVPREGLEVERMDPLGTAESVKAVSELFSPISGEVIDANEELVLNPELVNQDPYGRGWIAVLMPKNLEKEIKDLMNAEEYSEYLKSLLQGKRPV